METLGVRTTIYFLAFQFLECIIVWDKFNCIKIDFSRTRIQLLPHSKDHHLKIGQCFSLGPLCYMCMFRSSVVSNSLGSYGLEPARLLCPWDFPGKNTGVGCHFLLQGIYLPNPGSNFSTQGSNPHLLCLLYWQVDSLPLCQLGDQTWIQLDLNEDKNN